MQELHEMVRAEISYEYACLTYFWKVSHPTVTRKRCNAGKKFEIREHYRKCCSYRETGRAFALNDSIVRYICKEPSPRKNKAGTIRYEKGFKGNKEGAGKPLSYPKSVVEESVAWILRSNDFNLPCSSKLLVAKAKVLVTPHNPKFAASKGWLAKISPSAQIVTAKTNIHYLEVTRSVGKQASVIPHPLHEGDQNILWT